MNVCDADTGCELVLSSKWRLSDYATVMCTDTGSLYRLASSQRSPAGTDKCIVGRMWIPSESVSPRSRVSHSIVNEHSDSCDTVLDECSCEREEEEELFYTTAE